MPLVRTLFILGILLLTATVRAGDFEAANEFYDQGKFSDAKQLYERLVGQGEWSANLFYNLGNTDYRLGARGRAVLNYERALVLDGAHSEARANVQWLRAQTGARLPERGWWERGFPEAFGNVFAIGGVVAGWLVIFGFVASLIGRRSWGLVTCALFLAGYGACGVWLQERDRRVAVVTAQEAVARLAPADRASVAESLPAGSRVRILSERGEWIYCALPGGGLGWIAVGQLEAIRLTRS